MIVSEQALARAAGMLQASCESSSSLSLLSSSSSSLLPSSSSSSVQGVLLKESVAANSASVSSIISTGVVAGGDNRGRGRESVDMNMNIDIDMNIIKDNVGLMVEGTRNHQDEEVIMLMMIILMFDCVYCFKIHVLYCVVLCCVVLICSFSILCHFYYLSSCFV